MNDPRFRYSVRAHPRSRGENVKANATTGEVVGSSPLTRGKRRARTGSTHKRGLIPAHAGKTSFSGPRTCGCGAHPRIELWDTIAGLIPAHAGKTGLRGL